MNRILFSLLTILCLIFVPAVAAGEKPKDTAPQTQQKSVEELAKSAKSSIVVIKYETRPGQQEGLGTGFVISEDGLIATNLHVIGEARPISVQLANGKVYPVTTVMASDRFLDLAVLKIDAKKLKPLKLGDPSTIAKGKSIVALGHPQGLKHSVVSGVISGMPKIDGKPMLQLAIPIEPGNSGGPVLDRKGNVLGVVTLKSRVTANLGFAVPVHQLQKLVKKPNPIPMSRWVTIGKLNPDEWQLVFQGRWRQRSGKIIVDGAGEGFGGRSLCLSKAKTPGLPFEIGVAVRLSPESGAGGLAFHADGKNKHYGFYPSNGKMRLSRFMGPDVFSWKVLDEVKSEHYRPGEWNTLKVRIDKGKLQCYVNDHLVIESDDDVLNRGKAGMVKFRTTHVEFKNFRVGKKLPSLLPSEELMKEIAAVAAKINVKGPPKTPQLDSLVSEAPKSIAGLRQQAVILEKKANQLRKLAKLIHREQVLSELAKAIKGDEEKINLLDAALLIAKLDNEEIDTDAYQKQVERIAKEIIGSLPKNAADKEKIEVLNKELFEKRGFHGSRNDYYNKANSYLHQVLDDREGLPITLSVLYLELAHRMKLKVVGIGMPGHFVVQHTPAKGEPYLIDVFEYGKTMTQEQANKKVQSLTGTPLTKDDLKPVGKKDILVRMLMNLTNIARDEEDLDALIKYQDAILTVDPSLVEPRLLRAAARYEAGETESAISDLDWLLDNGPPDIDREKLIRLKQLLSKTK